MGDAIKRFSQLRQEVPGEGMRFGWDSQTWSLKSEFCRTAFPAETDTGETEKPLKRALTALVSKCPLFWRGKFNQH